MKRILLILILQNFAAAAIHSQSFTVHDLLTLPALPERNINHFMNKNGFILNTDNHGDDTITSYIQKIRRNETDSTPRESIDFYEQHNSKYFTLHFSSLSEYINGLESLVKSGFIYDTKKDINKESPILFQKANMTIESMKEVKDSRS